MNRRLAGDKSINAPVRDDGEAANGRTISLTNPPRRKPSSSNRTKGPPAQGSDRRDRCTGRPRTPHLRGAASGRRTTDAGRPRGEIQRIARTHPANRCARIRESTKGRQEPRRKSVGGDAASLVRCKLPACARKTSGREPAPVLVRSEPRQAPRAPRPRSWLSSGFKCPVDCPPYQLAITPRLASKVIGDRSAPQKSCVYRPPPGCRCICDMVRCISGLMHWQSGPIGATPPGLATRGAGPGSTCRMAFRIWRRNDRARPGHSPPDNRPRSNPARYCRRPPSGCA